MRTVFVDTSGFYALLDGTDPSHPHVRRCFDRARADAWRLVTTNYVIQESWALIQSRLGWEAVDVWLDRLVPLCEVLWVDQALHSLGEARCRQARRRGLSLTDCISMEVMHRRAIREFIGHDEDFSRSGFLSA